MSSNLTANNPTSYLGVKATKPPQMIIMQRAPTQNDVIGYVLGTQWLQYDPDNPADAVQYVLSSVEQKVAIWVPLNQGGDDPTLPNHSVVLGTGVPGFNSASPNTTLGQALVSTGASSDPEFGTVTVSGGGTGLDVVPQYTVICGGTTGEGPLQTVSGLGVATQVLTSNGAGLLPTWENPTGGSGGNGGPIAVQVFTMSDTYTPTVNMASCFVEIIGGGGGGGAIAASTGAAAGGGSGGYCRKFFLAATIGASQAVTIGAGGASTVSGSDSTFGALLTGGGGVAGTSGANGAGGAGGSAAGGDINISGGFGGSSGIDDNATNNGISGFGGSNLYGAGGSGVSDSGDTAGNPGTVYGSGGSGGARNTMGNSAGGAGADGVCIVTEFGPYAPVPPSAPVQLNIIVFDTPGADTYTPSVGMFQCIVEAVGGGAGAGSQQLSGSAGGYCKKLFDAATIGASQAIVVGAGGAGGIGLAIDGGNGLDTTFGAFLVAQGALGPIISTGPGATSVPGGATGGNINIPGKAAGGGGNSTTGAGGKYFIKDGGDSILGFGGVPLISFPNLGVPFNGTNGSGYGSGGSSGGANTGGNGASGVIIITEYIS